MRIKCGQICGSAILIRKYTGISRKFTEARDGNTQRILSGIGQCSVILAAIMVNADGTRQQFRMAPIFSARHAQA
jgi:hypothetical protein